MLLRGGRKKLSGSGVAPGLLLLAAPRVLVARVDGRVVGGGGGAGGRGWGAALLGALLGAAGGLEGARGSGGAEVEGFGFLAGDGAADEALEVAEGAGVIGADEADGVADGLGAAGAADAVDVVFGVGGEVVIDDVRDAVDVDAAGGDVGGDEDAEGAAAEVVEGLEALILGAVGVEGAAGDVEGVEAAGDAVGAVFGAGEDEDAGEGGVFEEVAEETWFEMGGDFVDPLGDGFGGVGAAADLDDFGVVLEFGGEGFDFFGEGGGEEEGLALAGEAADDAADRGEEAHVEHAVGLVEDEGLDAVKVTVALAEEVHEAAGAGDDEVGAGAEGVDLGAFADAAEDGGDGEGEVAGVGFDVFLDLDGEFAGGGEDEGAGAAAGGGRGEGHAVEEREGEGGGFAGAGLGDADEVAPGEDGGDGGGLDGGGVGVAGFLHGLEDARIESEAGERHSLSAWQAFGAAHGERRFFLGEGGKGAGLGRWGRLLGEILGL